MNKTEVEEKIKAALLKEYNAVPEIVSKRTEMTLSGILNSKEVNSIDRKPKLKWLVSGVSAAVIGTILVFSAPAMAASFLTNQALKNHAYVVWENHSYYATGQRIDPENIGVKIGEVKRAGDWKLKKDGDTNEFVPGSAIYRIKGLTGDEKFAVKSNISNLGFLSAYVEVQRGDEVAQPDPKTINSAKNDKEEVGIAMGNIEKHAPQFYKFKGIDHRVSVIKSDYVPEKGTVLYYSVPEADTKQNGMDIQGELFIFQYERGHEKDFPQSAFIPKKISVTEDGGKTVKLMEDPDFTPPRAIESFEMNGINWHYYSDQLLRGEKGELLYEVQTQGDFTNELIKDLLQHFKPVK